MTRYAAGYSPAGDVTWFRRRIGDRWYGATQRGDRWCVRVMRHELDVWDGPADVLDVNSLDEAEAAIVRIDAGIRRLTGLPLEE